MKPSFQIPTSIASSIIAFTALSNLAFGLTPMSDNFDDNLLDSAKWDYSPFTDGSLSESSGSINYAVSVPSIDGDYAELFYPSPFNPVNPGSNENWQVIVDVTNTSTPVSVGEISSAGIQIYDAANDGDVVFLELSASAIIIPE